MSIKQWLLFWRGYCWVLLGDIIRQRLFGNTFGCQCRPRRCSLTFRCFCPTVKSLVGLLWCLSSRESTCQTEDVGSIPGLGRSLGKKNDNLLHYSCLEILWTEEPCRLQSTGLWRVEGDLATAHACMSLRWLHVKKSVEAQYFNSGVTLSAFFIYSLSVIDGELLFPFWGPRPVLPFVSKYLNYISYPQATWSSLVFTYQGSN